MEIDRKYTVLVTGANSDIGVEVCRYFLNRGNDVIAIVILPFLTLVKNRISIV